MRSAGLLLHRRGAAGGREVLLVHPGGPFWARRDDGAWSIPKGEYAEPEDPFAVARREFEEEIGVAAPEADYEPLGEFRQPSRKVIAVFAAEADLTIDEVVSNTFDLEWPRGSGRIVAFPEVDDARWFGLDEARVKLLKGQVPMLDALAERLSAR